MILVLLLWTWLFDFTSPFLVSHQTHTLFQNKSKQRTLKLPISSNCANFVTMRDTIFSMVVMSVYGEEHCILKAFKLKTIHPLACFCES